MAPRFAAALGLLALAACHRGETSAQKESGDIRVSNGNGSAVVRTGGQLMRIRGIPDYPGADTSGSVQMLAGARGAEGDGQGAILAFRTADPPSQVINFYADAALRAGYVISQQVSMGPMAALNASHGGEGLRISATRVGETTQVQIVAGAGH